MNSNTGGPGDKAKTTTFDAPFRKGSKAASDPVDATERARPSGKYIGSTKQPIYRGTRDKHYDQQGVPKIKKNKQQMDSGT